MNNPSGDQLAIAPSPARSKKPVEPRFEALPKMPETPEELFRALAITVTTEVLQPHPTGKKPARKQEYALPWIGFKGWRDARGRLDHFENSFTGKVVWVPFNDNVANDGPMSLNANPGRALIERVTNAGDANLEAKALDHKGPMPVSPAAAAEEWFGLNAEALSIGLDDDEARQLARKTVTVTGFVGDPIDPKNSIFDTRDYGIGLSGAEMPDTILSLNRGNKRLKAWVTGKHGQGASSTYQYSDLTLIASRKIGAKNVAFTLVEGNWYTEGSVMAKTPTYRYLTIDEKIPEVELSDDEFPAGTLVRHIGYNSADLSSLIGEYSLYGLLMRSLAEPLFPVWLEIFSLRNTGKAQALPTFRGFRRYGRLIRGTVNALERAWADTLVTPPEETDSEEATTTIEEPTEINGAIVVEDSSATDEESADGADGTKILHRASEYFQLGTWDYGGRTGIGELGSVKINYWVADPASRRKKGAPIREWRDVLRNWVDPDRTVIMTLDGQTHAEESRSIVTSGAKLWAVGKYMVVQIDCNGLDPRAKYEMFTSTREHAKETPIRKMIVDELLRRLSFDAKLAELNVQLAAANIRQPEDVQKTISAMIKKYLKAAGINFEQLTRNVEKWIDVEEEQKVPAKPVLQPIAAVEPPTFVRWRFKGTLMKMHPGQRYSFLFETDAAPSYWNPADQSVSRIKVTAHGVRYVGSGEMKGGRVRCHFECPDDAAVGLKGFIQVQLEYAIGAALTRSLPVEIVEQPKPKPKKKPSSPEDGTEPPGKGESTNVIKIKVRKKDFTTVDIPVVTPQPVKMTDTAWATLGWPHDPSKVGFSIRPVSGKVHLYYNVEFPPFLDMKRKMSKKSLEEEFVHRYELKLVLHTIFTLNYDFFDEDDFNEEQKVRVRNVLCATAESLALATKSELEIESKLKSEDTAPLETAVAGNLKDAVALMQDTLTGPGDGATQDS